ncbi:MAG: DUF1540 domain-containing protein [Clostridiaceae bacterium]|nr:DUF1540 domain-containing protein [Clostridiaceae bacterium]
MNQLRCGVETCATYRDGFCCRSEIRVDGSYARAPKDTCCSSFQQEVPGMTNNAISQSPNPRCEVLCDAWKCAHNSNGCCCASSVDITGSDACTSGETSCRTFRER